MSNKKPDNKTYYIPIFMCIGISLGMTMGSIYGNIPVGMSVGVAYVVCHGELFDARSRK